MKTPQNPLDQLDQSLINARPAGHPNTTDFTAKTMAAIQATRAAETFSPVNRIINTTKREGLFMKLRSLSAPAMAALAITVLLAITGTAYAAYHISKQHAAQPKPRNQHVMITDPTAHWTPYTSQLGKFSLRYPTTWVQPPKKANCNGTLGDSILFLSPTAQAVTTCDSQMYVDSTTGNKTVDETPTNDPISGYANVVTTAVSVDGVNGTRSTAITTQDHPGHQYIPGSKIIQYVFYTNGMTYRAQYLQNPQGSNGFTRDVSTDFDLMVTKTLSFIKNFSSATDPYAGWNTYAFGPENLKLKFPSGSNLTQPTALTKQDTLSDTTGDYSSTLSQGFSLQIEELINPSTNKGYANLTQATEVSTFTNQGTTYYIVSTGDGLYLSSCASQVCAYTSHQNSQDGLLIWIYYTDPNGPHQAPSSISLSNSYIPTAEKILRSLSY